MIIKTEQNFNVSVPQLWKAITDLTEMHNWYFKEIKAFKAEEGFTTEFLIQNEGRNFTHVWKVLEVQENHKLVVEWTFKEYPGKREVTFDLEETANGSKLKLSNTGLESFPSDIPEFKPESCQAGWNYFINESLNLYLNQ